MASQSFYNSLLTTPVIYLPFEGNNQYGEACYGECQKIYVRWCYVEKKVSNSEGETCVSQVEICFPIGFEPKNCDCLFNPNGCEGVKIEAEEYDKENCDDLFEINGREEIQVLRCGRFEWKYYQGKLL